MDHKIITNYILISDRIASSGQPEAHQFKLIAAAKYQVVINLAMPNSDHAVPDEGNIVTAHNMIYLHIPVPFDKPSVEHLKLFFKAMDLFKDRKIWVHCVVNYRVSAFLYQYRRLVQGSTHDEAKKVMLPAWEPNTIWQQFMALTVDELNV
ncbi:MAG: protein tyrosine phosphatase family protein [Candidatus Thiodiazotropha sp. (ex Codakia rugifera)]|nr:protein tyrosine phosphatase family protein [Candidatus Thiodiazotropha sp. (ex Codakia rugifera)]